MSFNLFSTYVQLELKAKILLAEVLLKGFKQSVSDSSHARFDVAISSCRCDVIGMLIS